MRHPTHRITRGWLVLAALLCVPAAAAGADFAKLRTRGKTLARQRRYAPAAAIFTRILKEAPLDPALCRATLHDLQQVHASALPPKDFVRAVEDFLERVKQATLGKETNRTLRCTALQELTEHHRAHRKYPAAIESAKRMRKLATGPDVERATAILASLREDCGQYAEAAALCRQILALNSKNHAARMQLARLCLKLGRLNDGLSLLSGENKRTVYRMANDLLRAECLPQAEAVANTLVGKHAAAKALLGKIYFKQKRFGEAAKCLREDLMEARDHGYRLARMAEKLAEVYAACKTLPQAVRETEKEIADLKTAAATRPRRSKLLLLLAKLKEAAGDRIGSVEALLARQALSDKPGRPTYRLTKVVRDAVEQLLKESRFQEADVLLQRLDDARLGGSWTGCMRHVLLSRAGKTKEAAELLARLEAEAKTEAKLYSLALELGRLGLGDVQARLCRRIIEMEPHGSAHDANAHLHLARQCMKRQEYKEAKAHCDAVDTNVAADHMGIVGIERFRQIEALATYRAAGDDPDELVKMLSDERELRAAAAAKLLGQYGKLRHAATLEAAAANDDAPPKVRAAARAAARAIRERGMAAAKTEPMTPEQVQARVARLGKVLWIKEDPFDRNLRWAALARKFIVVGNLSTGQLTAFAEALAVLGYKDVSPSGAAFTADVVWVGTDHGLLAFERWSKSWNAYSVGLRHLDVPVRELAVREGKLVVTVEVGGARRTYGFDLKAHTWTEER